MKRVLVIACMAVIIGAAIVRSQDTNSETVIEPESFHPEQLTYLDDLDDHWLTLETLEYWAEHE